MTNKTIPEFSIRDSDIQNFETNAEKIVTIYKEKSEEDEMKDIYQNEIHYFDVLTNPTLQTIQSIIDDSDHHIMIFGEAGTGKTWISNRLRNITKSATTG